MLQQNCSQEGNQLFDIIIRINQLKDMKQIELQFRDSQNKSTLFNERDT